MSYRATFKRSTTKLGMRITLHTSSRYLKAAPKKYEPLCFIIEAKNVFSHLYRKCYYPQ